MNETFFDTAKNTEIEVAQRRVRFPIRYHDATTIGASFLPRWTKYVRFLPTDKLTPVQPMPGMAIVSLAAMAYRRIEGLAPYNEFGVTIPCVYVQEIQIPWAAWVVRLPSARDH